jgi:hypothetical protein
MKKIIVLLSIALFSTSGFAQIIIYETNDDSKDFTLSANYSYSNPSSYGLSAEFGSNNYWFFNQYISTVLNVSITDMEYNNNTEKVKGNGYAVELGSRFYRNRGRKSGVYLQWLLAYSSTNFDKNTSLGQFEGNYSFWSLINHDIGYKIKLGDHFSLDPSLGYNWKWEVKGKGDIDNIYVDNFVFRCGAKLSYTF